MAKARKVVTTVEKVITEAVPAIEITITREEAGFLMRLLMAKVEWTNSGEFGATCRDIYHALAENGGKEARWFTVSGGIWQPTK